MNNDTIKNLLQRFPLFKDLTEYEIEPIVDIAQHDMYRRGTYIFMQGDLLTNVYFIHQGKVKIYKTDVHGNEQIVNVLQAGDMFPHQGFFRQDDCPAHAEVLDDAILIHIPIPSFENALITHPEISIKLFRVLGDIIVDLQGRLEEKILHNTYEQIIMLLLRLSKGYGKEINEGQMKLTTQFTNRELANMIGSSRETVSRTITQLKKKNLLSTDNKGAIVLNVDTLEDELF
ncbi:Crp/Fnr family transcriptional regulator [Lentibacillus halophilus]|uniref:Crp/Fnr family transcriptional regulator n=1 Tax=Lentibacillus halophilus TaxID=295065 RepID=A0ABP3IZ07_9BACI